jgi:hypothetical protein
MSWARPLAAAVACLAGLAGQAGAVDIPLYHRHDFSFEAPVQGNPFDVEVTGEFSGPGGSTLKVPGFYDGGGVWKIRFSPTVVGAWRLRTVSAVAALNGKTETGINCTPNRNPNVHGAVRIDPRNPRHFVYEDGTRYFFMGYEADWLWAIGMDDPKREVMHRLIGQMATYGFNQVLVNVYAHDTRWSPGRQNQWDYGPPAMYAWEGTNENPDHSRFNVRFFQLYDGMMEALHAKGIVAHIMLKVYNKFVNWPAPHSKDEERYFRYVVARYQGFSNVIWDYSKETKYEKDKNLISKLVDLVRSTDGYRRLVTIHDDVLYHYDPARIANIDFYSDQYHSRWAEKIAFDRTIRNWPAVNVEFGYERGVDKLPTYGIQHGWDEQLRRAWLVYLAGGYGVYYYANTAWDLVKPDPEPPGYSRFRVLADALSALPYWEMEPMNEITIGDACLVKTGEAYACYCQGQQMTVNLQSMGGRAKSAEWVDTWTGSRMPAPVTEPAVYTLSPPRAFAGAPAVLIVRR